MKIMHLLPSLSSGGVEQVVLELCRGMVQCGEECTVVSAGGRMVEQIRTAGAGHIRRSIEKKNPHLLIEVWRMAKLLKREAPQIVHVHSRVPAWVLHFAYRLLLARQRPALVSSFHGFHSVNAYSRIMTRGDAVVAVSQCIREHILQNYPSTPRERVHVIPNSVDTSLFFPTFHPSEEWLQQWRAEHPELTGRYVLCLPGRISRIKGQSHVVPLLSHLLSAGVPAHVLIIGETKRGKEKLAAELDEQVRAAGIQNHVSRLNHRNDLREIMSVSDAVLNLSLQPESFGKVTLEALALGRPVVGYNHGGVSEQLRQFLPEGLIPVGNPQAAAERLANWYRNPPKLLEPVASPYLREDMIHSHLSLYRSLL